MIEEAPPDDCTMRTLMALPLMAFLTYDSYRHLCVVIASGGSGGGETYQFIYIGGYRIVLKIMRIK